MPNHGTKKVRSYWLVTDEIITVWSKSLSRDVCYRVRIWQGPNISPLVLVSQTPTGPPVSYEVTKVANHVWVSFLRFHKLGMDFFLSDRHCRIVFDPDSGLEVASGSVYRKYELVQFLWAGKTRLRTFPSRPQIESVSVADIEGLIGEHITEEEECDRQP